MVANNKLLVAINIILIVAILVLIFYAVDGATPRNVPYGFSSSEQILSPFNFERFEDADAAEDSPKKTKRNDNSKTTITFEDSDYLNPKETELFEDLKQNKLSEDDIKSLIENGTLTDALMNKFLKKMDFPALMKKDETKESFTDAVEPFACEDLYVGKPQNWTPDARWWDGTLVDPDASAAAATDKANKNNKSVRGKC